MKNALRIIVGVGLTGVLVTAAVNSRSSPAPATVKPPDNPEAFLTLPFKDGAEFRVAEGWLYSDEERKIHGRTIHNGIDFAAPRGTPVYAAADGLAIASFDTEADGTWQGKQIGFGYGRFVQVYHPETDSFTLYSHLESFALSISYEQPLRSKFGYEPVLPKTKAEVEQHQTTPIKKGDLIGYVGDTGLTWGYAETPTQRPDPEQFPSWDEPHLHFEVFSYEDGQKVSYDPYGIYRQASQYNSGSVIGETLWFLDENNQPRSML